MAGELIKTDQPDSRKFFRALMPLAARRARQILTMSDNESLVRQVIRDVAELSGEGGGKSPVIQINDSQIQLLVQVAREASEG